MIVRLANGKEYTACTTGNKQTAATPSNISTVRSKMDIYLSVDAMALEDFINEFSNEENLETITFVGESFENVYKNYTVVSSVGKELAVEVDASTGVVTEEYRLAAHLEQLTYIEKKLKELGL